MTLRDQGFRFIKRGSEFKWAHPADVQASDVDCTDMGDDEFAAYVAAQAGKRDCESGSGRSRTA